MKKTVTGLILKDKPEVPPAFINTLQDDISRLKHVLEFSSVTNHHVSVDWITKFRQQVQGKLRFIQMVYGGNSPVFTRLQKSYHEAFNTMPFEESFNWNDIPYF